MISYVADCGAHNPFFAELSHRLFMEINAIDGYQH